MPTRHENIPILWAEYLALLEEAKKNLEASKDKFKTGLLDQAEVRCSWHEKNNSNNLWVPPTYYLLGLRLG